MELLINYLQQGFSAVIPFIILLGLLIFVHELGHFLVAKWCGVRVEVFSLGFGKKILSYKKGDTVYCISLIPLGGYVKMFGDEVGAEIPEEEKKFSFTYKNVWARIAIVIAGPLMNFFFAILIFFFVAIIGEEVKSPYLGDIMVGSKAYENGFRSGDKIMRVNGIAVRSWDDIQKQLTADIGQSVNFVVKREPGDQVSTISSIPNVKPNPNILSLSESIGTIDGFSNFSSSSMIGVKANSQAYKMGLRTGDRITTINGNEIKYYREIENILIPLQKQSIKINAERYSQEGKVVENLKLDVNFGEFSSLIVTGIEGSDLYLAKIIENSPAQKANLQTGDKILKVNDLVPSKWEDVLNAVKAYSGSGGINLEIERGGEKQIVKIEPQYTTQPTLQGGEEKRYTIGIYPWVLQAPIKTSTIKYTNPKDALFRGVERTWDVTVMTVVSFLRLIQNKISPKNIGGVISIGQAASETFKIGISHFLTMMAIISVNLFILNLLPIPVLDGGHLLFYTIEAIRGTPLNMRKMEIAQQIGLVLLLSLMIFALFNDFSRLFGFW